MNKFNKARRNLAQERRNKRAQEKKLRLGVSSIKLSTTLPPRTISGKAQRKLEKKWRRSQKEALESGLVTMEDIEVITADRKEPEIPSKPKGIIVKKRVKIRSAKKRNPVSKLADAPEVMQE